MQSLKRAATWRRYYRVNAGGQSDFEAPGPARCMKGISKTAILIIPTTRITRRPQSSAVRSADIDRRWSLDEMKRSQTASTASLWRSVTAVWRLDIGVHRRCYSDEREQLE
jgi:hypothetical protein